MSETVALEYSIELEGFSPTQIRLSTAEVHEELFGTYRLRLSAFLTQWEECHELLFKPASLLIRIGSTERSFHGVVRTAEIQMLQADVFRLDFEVVPKLDLLKLGRDHRIFQELNVVDVVSQVLDGAQLAGEYEWSTNGSYDPRPYIVQYGESDFEFITRLLGEYGIGFAIHNDIDAAKIIFFDDDSAFTPIDTAVLVERQSMATDVQAVWDVTRHLRAASDAVMLRDYDFTKPAVDLSVEATTPESVGRQVYRHPGGFLEETPGQTRADRLLERLQLPKEQIFGRSACIELEPGRLFSISRHPHEAANGEFLLLAVSHRLTAETGAEASYDNHLLAVASDVPYRPPSTEKPVIGGAQNAFVTGPSGEELHCSENGQVKVRFPWDRSGTTDDTSSTWLRVGQYPVGGSMIIPRVDFEVSVDFEMGDIDRPLVSAHLYNGEARVPYELPGGATRSSIQTNTTGGGGGANELRFEDAAGAEEIFLNASHDYTVAVDHDADRRVAVDETYEIGANRTVKIGGNHKHQVIGDESVTVGANQIVVVGQASSSGVVGSYTLNVGAMRKIQTGADFSQQTGGTLSRTIGALQAFTGIAGLTRKIAGNSTTSVGAAWAEVVGGSRMLTVGTTYVENVGALKYTKAETVAISCGAAYVMNAAAEKIEAGGSRTDSAGLALSIAAGGGMTVAAKSITFSAEKKLSFRGGGVTIELTSSGQVTLKATKAVVKNAKVLTQIMHKSG
ncbi:MAG: type VI secretion system tip protein TssI/VgrG [Myxococcota bacterium]